MADQPLTRGGDSSDAPPKDLLCVKEMSQGPGETELLRKAFDMYDYSKDGAIDTQDFMRLMGSLGIHLTLVEAQDMVTEVDTDGSGMIEFNEFHTLMTRHKGSVENEIREVWLLLDQDKSGTLTASELKSVLFSCGIRLAIWELRDMMNEADLDGDGLVSYEEFQKCYDSFTWMRCRNLVELNFEMENTWRLLDRDKTGSISYGVLQSHFGDLGFKLSEKEIRRMMDVADEDNSGDISMHEFRCAFLSDTWQQARLLGATKKGLLQLKRQQEALYKNWKEEEQGALGGERVRGFEVGIPLYQQQAGLMARRSLRRAKPLRIEVNKIWKALAMCREPHADWVQKPLFLTYYLHLCESLDEEHFEVNEGLAAAEEEWDTECRKPLDRQMLSWDQTARQKAGDMSWAEPPFALKYNSIGFSHFFEGFFAFADTQVGATGEAFADKTDMNSIDSAVYVQCIELHCKEMLIPEVGIPGQAPLGYRWRSPELVQPGCPVEWQEPGAREEYETYLVEEKNTAARKIQSRFRIQMAHRTISSLREDRARRHHALLLQAVVRLQAFHRGQVARRKCRWKRKADAALENKLQEKAREQNEYMQLPMEERQRLVLEERHQVAKAQLQRQQLVEAVQRNVIYVDPEAPREEELAQEREKWRAEILAAQRRTLEPELPEGLDAREEALEFLRYQERAPLHPSVRKSTYDVTLPDEADACDPLDTASKESSWGKAMSREVTPVGGRSIKTLGGGARDRIDGTTRSHQSFVGTGDALERIMLDRRRHQSKEELGVRNDAIPTHRQAPQDLWRKALPRQPFLRRWLHDTVIVHEANVAREAEVAQPHFGTQSRTADTTKPEAPPGTRRGSRDTWEGSGTATEPAGQGVVHAERVELSGRHKQRRLRGQGEMPQEGLGILPPHPEMPFPEAFGAGREEIDPDSRFFAILDNPRPSHQRDRGLVLGAATAARLPVWLMPQMEAEDGRASPHAIHRTHRRRQSMQRLKSRPSLSYLILGAPEDPTTEPPAVAQEVPNNVGLNQRGPRGANPEWLAGAPTSSRRPTGAQTHRELPLSERRVSRQDSLSPSKSMGKGMASVPMPATSRGAQDRGRNSLPENSSARRVSGGIIGGVPSIEHEVQLVWDEASGTAHTVDTSSMGTTSWSLPTQHTQGLAVTKASLHHDSVVPQRGAAGHSRRTSPALLGWRGEPEAPDRPKAPNHPAVPPRGGVRAGIHRRIADYAHQRKARDTCHWPKALVDSEHHRLLPRGPSAGLIGIHGRRRPRADK